MKHIATYKNDSFNMKPMATYITEYIIKKKLDTPIDSEDHYEYHPKTKDELKKNIIECIKNDKYDLNCIDTSKITDMSYLFGSLNNVPIQSINFDVSKWDVSNVEYMQHMFSYCKNFNGDLSKWNVSNVENMYNMFNECTNFDCDLSNWDVSKVENMFAMFDSCKNFIGEGLENWDVSNVKRMGFMFNNCKNFNCDLSGWNVSNVNTMERMFYGCEIFEGKGLENWDVSNVDNMSNMFFNCKKFDCDLSNWNISNVKFMERMFYNCKKFKVDCLENWKITTKVSKRNIFYGTKNTPSWYKK